MKLKRGNLLTVILAMLCTVAIALGVGFLLPKAENINAEAAVEPDEVEYSATCLQYQQSGNRTDNIPYSLFGAPDSASYGEVSFTGKTAKLIKLNLGNKNLRQINDYCAISASIEVPAKTEYTVTFDYSLTLSFSSSGTAKGRIEFFYFGDTANDSTAIDQSSNILFAPYAGKASTPNTYMRYSAEGKSANKAETAFVKMVCTNDGEEPKTFTAYFGVYTCASSGSSSANSYTGTLTMSDTVTVTPTDAPTVAGGSTTTPGSSATAEYDGTDQTFNFAYDHDRVELTSVSFKDTAGKASSLTDSCTIDSSGNCSLKDAGTYTFKFDIAEKCGAVWDSSSNDQGAKTLTVTINPKKVSVPTIQNSTQTYKAEEYEFELLNYDSELMSVSSYISNNGSSITWDDTKGAEKFNAKDAATYTVKFHMDSLNHIWDVGSGTTADQSKPITINKKQIDINTAPLSNTNPSWDFGAEGSIAVEVTASDINDPDFVVSIYYVLDTAPNSPITTGWDSDENKLDISQIASTGKYTLYVELTSAAANKNYSIANDKFEMPFEIKSGGIDFSVIDWTYKEGSGNATPLYNGNQQADIRYKLDDDDNEIKYYISASIPSGGYLSVDTSYNSDGFNNGFYTTFGGTPVTDGCASVGTYKTRIALISDSDHLFKSADNSGSFGGDDTKGWYEIEWKIEKGKVDPNYFAKLNQYLQYKPAGGTWTKYDPENPPQYGNGAIEIRLDPAKYAAGITAAEVTVNDKQTAIGSYTATVKFTYDPNYENEGNKSFTWQIGAKNIEVDWTSDTWIKDGQTEPVVDSNSVPYQIRVLNVADDLKQYIEYKYYIADPGDPAIKSTYIGKGDTGLQDLISAPYNASSTNAVYVYVEAVLKDGVTQYKLVDNTGNDYTNCMLFQFGATNTLVKVSLTETEMNYGDNKLALGIVSMLDTGVNAQLDQSTYVEGIYIIDPQGNNLGLLKDYNCATAGVGIYTIKIVLNDAGEATYTLSPGATLKFTVKPKAIAVPTVGVITFNNQFVNLADYLGGTWNDYKDIIKLGGTHDGVKNANVAYTATLTLTDTNYCWDYGSGVTPVKAVVKYSLADSSYSVSGDETVANYEWKITPYALKASSWNLKGKEGAVYNIPAELTDGLDVDINYLYHPDKNSSPLGDGESLTAGSTYFVKAQLIGADRDNFVFEDSNTTTSDFATYKVPQSGAAVALNAIKGFMTRIVAGLPVWAWLLIALALIILLIIIIVVAKKRHKTKEQREEIKARKEEEKARKEEERQRREEERRLQQERLEEERRLQREKLEAERELARAKQEAELEKIRAQAGMAGAGMATMAMAQQPTQQAMPPIQQVQTVDNDFVKEMREQMAELRADNKATQEKLAAMQNNQQQAMPAPMMPTYQAMPTQYPMYQQPMMPQYGGDPTLARLEAQLNAMQAEQRARYDAEQRIELAAMRAEQHVDRDSRHSVDLAAMREHFNGKMGYTNLPDYSQPNSIEALGAIVAAALKNMANGETAATQVPELPQKAEQEPVAKYPSDAVITTTTTVDTTKNGAIRRSRDEEENFDVDGFYDSIDY